MNEKNANNQRKEIEAILVRKYEGGLVEIIVTSDTSLLSGIIRTIGVEWLGADEFEVIINLDGKRITIPYEDFILNTTVI